MTASVTNWNALLQQPKHFPICLHIPVFFFSAAFLLLYICPCPFTPSQSVSSRFLSPPISFLFSFLYLTRPVPCRVMLHSFPVIAFCLAPGNPAPKGLFINIYLTFFWLWDNQVGIFGVGVASGLSLMVCSDSVNVAENHFDGVALTAPLTCDGVFMFNAEVWPKIIDPHEGLWLLYFGSYHALEPKIRGALSSPEV